MALVRNARRDCLRKRPYSLSRIHGSLDLDIWPRYNLEFQIAYFCFQSRKSLLQNVGFRVDIDIHRMSCCQNDLHVKNACVGTAITGLPCNLPRPVTFRDRRLGRIIARYVAAFVPPHFLL